jgi:hypothetical protein
MSGHYYKLFAVFFVQSKVEKMCTYLTSAISPYLQKMTVPKDT